MIDASPELQQRVSTIFSRHYPQRVFQHCKVVEIDGSLVIRIYSHDVRFPVVIPPPYQIFRFDTKSGALNLLSGEEAAPFTIQNYK